VGQQGSGAGDQGGAWPRVSTRLAVDSTIVEGRSVIIEGLMTRPEKFVVMPAASPGARPIATSAAPRAPVARAATIAGLGEPACVRRGRLTLVPADGQRGCSLR